MTTLALPPLKWVQSPNYSSRGPYKARLIVAHDCEGSYAGSINWFAQAKSQVSAHIVLSEDGLEATQMVSWGNKAWHACNFNPFSEGIEAAGFSAKGFGSPELDDLAAIIAWRLHVNGIPCQEANSFNNWTGFTEHAKLGVMGGGHHDFTENDGVWAAFVLRVQAAFAQTMPDSWPIAGHVSPPPAPPGFIPNPNGRSDERVGSIAWAQAKLNAVGAATPPLIVDGIEGHSTEHAIVIFQQRNGLYIDGILGPKTIKALAA